ncbi:MAG: hypothetical protein PHF46_01480 [Candidatus Gracilibacteria bacterium]|nr:hypothetical protein [Candidatus Gracilibacteria bacterium]MDD3120063.1 hypothetical protein [Candidatus Gracilibacteria bacterium]MDD4530236.1 hypothetical protein [Candidatus Gracilibacteria bacterium]
MQEKIKGTLEKMSVKQKVFTFFSIFLIVTIVVLSTVLFISNSAKEGQLNSAKETTENYIKQIEVLKNDKYILAYNIVSQAKESIDLEITKSSVGKYLQEFERISKNNPLISFAGFSYNNGKITTTASAEGRDDKDAVFNITRFIKKSREDKESPFILEPITTISGDEKNRIFMPVEFTIK